MQDNIKLYFGGGSGRKVFPVGENNSKDCEQLIAGSQGYRVYGAEGVSTTLASQAGGGRSKNRSLSRKG